MNDSINRFTKTVNDYIHSRPAYPNEIIQLLVTDCGLTKDKIIADVGSGTGLLTKLFLDFGNTVYGVEPNQAMREAGEIFLKQYPKFQSVDGRSEATTLKSDSIDLVSVGTAFHWFEVENTKREFKRILKSPGWVVLIWNVRNTQESPLMKAYDDIVIEFGSDYKTSTARKFDLTATTAFFAPFEMKVATFKNSQRFDWEGFKGRLLSTSYSLRPEDGRYEEMIQALKMLFDRYQQNGMITFLYQTKLYYGRLT